MQESYRIGPWELLPALNLVRRGDTSNRLEPRYVDLLVYLARNQGRVVSTEEIISKVWDRQMVGEHSVYQAIARLRSTLGDDAQNPSFIETVPKRGYRLICNVETAGPPAPVVDTLDSAIAEPALLEARLPKRSTAYWIPWLLGLTLLAAGAWLAIDREGVPHDPRPSVLVLPFSSLSAVDEDRFIAEGFSIELTNRLESLPGIHVLGPRSARLTVTNGLPMKEIEQRLAADVMIEGSLRRAKGRLRVTATMTDVHKNEQIWSQIVELNDDDIFEIQATASDAMAQKLRELFRIAPAPTIEFDLNPGADAYDEFLLGRYFRHQYSPEALLLAADHFKKVLDTRPGYTKAHIGLATTFLLQSYYGDLPLSEALKKAELHLAKARNETPTSERLSTAVGLSYYLQGDLGLAEEHFERAVTRQHNFAEAWLWLGLTRRQQGHLRSALTAFDEARKLEPVLLTPAIEYGRALVWTGHVGAGRESLKAYAAKSEKSARLYRALSDLALDAGDLVDAFRQSKAAIDFDPASQLARAGHAMILAYFGHEEQAAALFSGIVGGNNQPTRMVQRFLDRTGIAAPKLFGPLIDNSHLRQLQDRSGVPEIEWRLANARIGIADYFAGNYQSTADHLRRALEGRTYPIERTDYDLFICTTLVDAYGHLDEKAIQQRWLDHCRRGLNEAINEGWSTVSLYYSAARIAALEGSRLRMLQALGELPGKGFRNIGVLRADPVFAGLHRERKFKDLLGKTEQLVAEAWRIVNAQENHKNRR